MEGEQEIGKRANKLNKLNLRYATAVVESLSLEIYNDCLQPLITDKNKHLIDEAYEQLIAFALENCLKTYEEIIAESNVIEKLNKLEEAVDDAKRNPSRPQKTVPKPVERIRALRVKLKWEALAKLKESEAKLREENASLMNEVVTKVDRLAVTKSNIEAVYNQFEKTMETAAHIPTDALEHMVERLA